MKHPALVALAALLLAPFVSAHVVLAEPEAAPNAYYVGSFRISHGCGASPTTAVRIEIPESIVTARPQPKAGWTVEVERQTLTTRLQSEYGPVTERVVAVTWRGLLPADQFDQFSVLLKLPAAPGPLYFPVIQTCAEGERRWDDIPAAGQAWHAVESPAAVLTLRPAQAPDAHHH